jgi:hypothetical protein
VTSDIASVDAAVAKWSSGLIIDPTPGLDAGAAFTGTPGDDVFNALISSGGQQTLKTGDVLAGAGGSDTLIATLGEQSVLPSLSSIETVDVPLYRSGNAGTVECARR